MSMIVRKLPKGVDQTDPWPYTKMPERAITEGPWSLAIDAGGSVVLWPGDEEIPEDIGVIVFAHGEKENLEHFQTTFCSVGYNKEPRYKYQDGTMYGFNWVSGTLATVNIASQVAERFLYGGKSGYQEAWAIGRSFENQINAALREEA